jgi:hypothetical protein
MRECGNAIVQMSDFAHFSFLHYFSNFSLRLVLNSSLQPFSQPSTANRQPTTHYVITVTIFLPEHEYLVGSKQV